VLQDWLLSEQELERWGWRIPFLIGAAFAVVVAVLRRDMAESSAFTAASHRVRQPLRELARHPRAIAIVFGLTLGGTVSFYTYTTYMQKFLVNPLVVNKPVATGICALALLLFLPLQPL